MITIKKESEIILTSADRVVIGFSGGVDSIAVLDILVRNGVKNIVAAHINHGISDNADAWESFCEKTAKDYGVDFVSRKVNLKGESNLEEVAREVRYDFFDSLMTENSVLVTGHHMNDQAETFLLRLMRGAGVDGLGAMRKVRDLNKGKLLRPFLDIKKSDFLKYALTNDLQWVEDESNESSDYDRNFIRNKVIPLLSELNPNAVDMINKSASLAQEASDTVSDYVEVILDGDLKGKPLELSDKFHSLERKDMILCCRKLLRDNNIPSIPEYRWNDFLNSIESVRNRKNSKDQKLKLDLGGGLSLRKLDEKLVFSSEDDELSLKFSGDGFISRKRKPSDRFFYRGRERKLKDVMIMMEIPHWLRDITPLLVCVKSGKIAYVGEIASVEFELDPIEVRLSNSSKHSALTKILLKKITK